MRFGFTRHEIKPASKEKEEEFSRAFTENKVGFKDKFAMLIGAFVSIILPCLLILGALSLLAMFLFGVFR